MGLRRLAKKISRRETNRALAGFVQGLPPGQRILNIGAGGNFEEIIRENIPHTDIVLHSADIDPARNPDVVDDITQTGLPENSYDCIICLSVLEHVTDPVAAAQNMYRILSPGGRCLIAVPFLFPLHEAPHDYFRFTEFGIRELFSRFEILRVDAANYWWETLLLLLLRVLWFGDAKMRLGVRLAFIPIGLFIPLMYLLSRRAPNPGFTANFLVELRKPAPAFG